MSSSSSTSEYAGHVAAIAHCLCVCTCQMKQKAQLQPVPRAMGMHTIPCACIHQVKWLLHVCPGSHQSTRCKGPTSRILRLFATYAVLNLASHVCALYCCLPSATLAKRDQPHNLWTTASRMWQFAYRCCNFCLRLLTESRRHQTQRRLISLVRSIYFAQLMNLWVSLR